MGTERAWRGTFTVGISIGLPIGALVSVIGLILGLLQYTWVTLWIGLGIILLSILLILYAMFTPMLRMSSAMRQFDKQMAWNVIGQGIAWENVDNEFLRITEFTPNATVDGQKVRANSRTSPYAMLKVESSLRDQPLIMPVLHRLDFLHLWQCFNENVVGDTEELIVCYRPSRLGKGMPHLALLIGPKGSVESYVSRNSDKDVFSSTRTYWDPAEVWRRNH